MGVPKRLTEMQMNFAHEVISNEGRKNALVAGHVRLYEGKKILQLVASGLELDACCLGLEACRLRLESI